MSRKNTIILSIATNGYDGIFSDVLDSHRNFASRHGYCYYVLTHFPCFNLNASMSSWLKIPMILSALTRGYNVAFFDADALIQPCAGSIDDYFAGERAGCVYLAKDQGCPLGGINAGVEFASPGVQAIDLYRKIIRYATLPNRFLPNRRNEDISLYEQGHVRWAVRNCKVFRLLDPRWNWTSFTQNNEYVWHAHAPGMWKRKINHGVVEKRKQQRNYFPRSLYLARAKFYFDKVFVTTTSI